MNNQSERKVSPRVENKGRVESDARVRPGQGFVRIRDLPCVTDVEDASGEKTLPVPSSRVYFTVSNRTVSAVGEKCLAAEVLICISPEDELHDDPKPEAKVEGSETPAEAAAPPLSARDKFVDELKEASNVDEIRKCRNELKLMMDSAVNGNVVMGYGARQYEETLQTRSGRPAMRYFVFYYGREGEDSCFDLNLPMDKLMEVVASRGMTDPVKVDDRRTNPRNDRESKNRILVQARSTVPFKGGYVPETILVVKRPDFRPEEKTVEEPVLDGEGKPVLDAEGKAKTVRTVKKVFYATTPGFAILLRKKCGVRIVEHFRAVQRRVKPELDSFVSDLENFLQKQEGRRTEFAKNLPGILSGPEPQKTERLELDYPEKGAEIEPAVARAAEQGADGSETPPEAPVET